MKKILKKSLAVVLALAIVFGSAVVDLNGFDKDAFVVEAKASSIDDLTFEKVTAGGGYQYTVGYSLTKCDTTATGEIVIPDTYNGLPVTYIEEYAFDRCENVTSVIVPDSVKSTGYRVFNKCKNLVSVDLGDGITYLNASVFYDCSSLEKVIFPENLKAIGKTAFRNCTNLNTINLPQGITRIEESAFSNTGCLNKEDNWENNVLYMGKYLIAAKPALSGAYNIKAGTEVIAEHAFSSCSNLVLINIPDGVRHIGYRAFRGTGYYANKTNWKNGALYIGKYLIRLDIEFEGSCTIKEGTEVIADQAFYNCDYLSSLRFPASVKEIGSGAFTLCNVSTVYITDLAAWLNINGGTPSGGFLYVNDVLINDVVVPDGITKIYSRRLSFDNIKTVKLPDSVKTIGYGAFSYCKNLNSINLPDGLISIGEDAFDNCSSLSAVTIPDSVTYIGDNAFRYCTGITSIEMPEGSLEIGDWVFANCSKLTSIKFSDGVTEIGEGAFLGCTSLVEIYVPATLKKWGYRSFENCNSLQKVNITDLKAWCESDFIYHSSNPLNNGAKLHINGTIIEDLVIPDTVTKIGKYAFYNCKSFKSIKIGKNVQAIGDCAFYGCANVVSIQIPEKVTTIGRQSFAECEKLETVTLSKNVESIGEFAFSDCLKLKAFYVADGNAGYSSADGVLFNSDKTVLLDYPINKSGSTYTMPDTVTEISAEAFKGCTQLTSIELSENLKIIGSSAFSGCSNLASVNIPRGVTIIKYSAFRSCTSLTAIEIPDTVTELEHGVFYSCENLAEIYIPDSVTVIESGLLNGTAYYNNEENWDGEGLYVGNHLIRVKSSTGAYEVKDGTKIIANSAFDNCSGLTILILPDTITTIGSSAFQFCNSLTEIFVPSLTTWCNIDFKSAILSTQGNLYVGNSLVKDIIIPENVTKINDYAFNQFSINSVKLHDGVKSIGKSAFRKCLNLSSVELGRGLESVGEQAFYDCENLKTVKIDKNVTDIGVRAFGYYSTYYGLAHSKVSNFKIIGDKNTAAYNYANENSIKFEIECAHKNTEWITSMEPTVYREGQRYQRCAYCYKWLDSEAIPQLKCESISLKKVYNTTDGVKITWGRVKGADAYRVYRKVKGSGWEYLDSTKNGYFTDATAKTGTTYYYTVRAKNEAGLSSYNTKGLSIKYVASPGLTKIQNVTGGLKITWSKVSGADGYYVYRKLYGADSWTRIATIKSGSTVSYKDTKVSGGKVYVYTVKAYDGSGKSATDSAGIKLRYLAAPTLNTPSSTTKGVGLRWTEVAGAEGYMVYRKTGSSGSYTKIKTEKGISNLTYRDTTAKKGTKYYYKVKAYKGTTYSAYSNTKAITDKY